jgi:hypothetical protein
MRFIYTEDWVPSFRQLLTHSAVCCCLTNCEGIQATINEALDWEKRSSATFEGKKTILVHFTRNSNRTSTALMTIKEEVVTPKETAKILGVIMDSKL